MELLTLRLALILFIFSPFAFADNSVINLRLARPSNTESPQNQYIHALLRQSFAQVGKQVSFIYTIKPMNKDRIVEQLNHDKSIDLAWLSIDPQSQENLVHTSLPIYQGLHGKRLLIINKSLLNKFAAISSIDELKPLIGLQKQSWSDFYVLKRNGLSVNGDLSYKEMIRALDTGLGDYFPRSVSAVEAEISKQQHLNLVVEPTIMLQYSSHYYFYSHKNNQSLLQQLELGLQKLQQSGEFELLYQRFFGAKEQRLNLATRKVFHLE